MKRIGRIPKNVYQISSEGLMAASGFAEGRFIAAVVLKADESDYMNDIISLHANDNITGDIEIVWAKNLSLLNKSIIYLSIKFTKPVEHIFVIAFPIPKFLITIDAILQSKGLRIAISNEDQKVSEVSEHMIVEIPETDFNDVWDDFLKKELIKKYNKKGYPKKQRKELAATYIKEMRDLLITRVV